MALLAGHAGRWMAERLAGEGIPTRSAWTSGETRTCLAIHDAADGTLTEMNEAGPRLSPTEWTGLEDAVSAELDRPAGPGCCRSPAACRPAPRTTGSPGARVGRRDAGVPVALDGPGGEVLRLRSTPGHGSSRSTRGGDAATLGQRRGPGRTTPASATASAPGAGTRAGGARRIVTRGRAGAIAVGPDGQTYRVGRPRPGGELPGRQRRRLPRRGGGRPTIAGSGSTRRCGSGPPQPPTRWSAGPGGSIRARSTGSWRRSRSRRSPADRTPVGGAQPSGQAGRRSGSVPGSAAGPGGRSSGPGRRSRHTSAG